MTPTPLRVGFAGAHAERAWAKDAHLPAVRAVAGLQLVAVSAREQHLADAAAAAFGASRAYGDTLEMVRDPDIDIIAVTAKVPEHRKIVLAALQAGKHLYCEWPLGRDLAEAEEMARAAAGADVHVAIGLQGAFSTAVRQAAALVRDGAIGRPLSLRVVSPTAGWGAEAPQHYLYLQDRQNGATLSTIAGGHTLAAMEEVVGQFTEVGAVNSILRDRVMVSGTGETVSRTCADHVLVTGRHSSGCVSSLEVLGGEVGTAFVFELRGTDGWLKIDGNFPGGYQAGDLYVTANVDTGPEPEGAAPDLHGPGRNVSEIYARLAADIRSGMRTVPNFDRAVRLTRLLDAIDTASDEGRRIHLGT